MPDFTDDFNRPDSETIGNGWTEESNGFQIQGGAVVGLNPGSYPDLYVYRPSPSADYEAAIEWIHLRDSGVIPVYDQLWVRLNDPEGTENAYGMFFGDGNLELIRDNNFSWTILDSIVFSEVSSSIVNGDTYRFRIRVLGSNPVRLWAYCEHLVGSSWELIWHGYAEDTSASRVTGAGNTGWSRYTEANNLYRYTKFQYTDLSGASNTHILGHGDSIAYGSNGYPSNRRSQVWPPLIGCLQKDDFDADIVRTFSYYNSGVFGETSTEIASRLAALLSSEEPDVVYIIACGTNDLTSTGATDGACLTVCNTIISNLTAMKADCDAAGVLMRVSEQPPHTVNQNGLSLSEGLPEASGELKQKWYKRLNAMIRQWGRDNGILVGPNYEDSAWRAGGLRTDDDFSDDPAYDDDGIHPTVLGYKRLGELYSVAVVPSKFFSFGHTLYPRTNYYGWIRWLLSGGASITGDPNTGTLDLPDSAVAASSVLCLYGESTTLFVTLSGVTGSVSIEYRTSDGNFDRDAGSPSWVAYDPETGIDLSSNDFIQIRLTASGASSVESVFLLFSKSSGGVAAAITMAVGIGPAGVIN